VPGLREGLEPCPDIESKEHYDPRKRDPEFANASASPLWELVSQFSGYNTITAAEFRTAPFSQPLSSFRITARIAATQVTAFVRIR